MDATHGTTATSVGSTGQDLVITRVFDAPRALVFNYGMSASWPSEAAPAAEREMCRQGWAESLDRLAAYLATA